MVGFVDQSVLNGYSCNDRARTLRPWIRECEFKSVDKRKLNAIANTRSAERVNEMRVARISDVGIKRQAIVSLDYDGEKNGRIQVGILRNIFSSLGLIANRAEVECKCCKRFFPYSAAITRRNAQHVRTHSSSRKSVSERERLTRSAVARSN